MKEELKHLLIDGLNEINIKIEAGQLESFNIFLKELIKWNSKYNLTAITDEKDIIIKHFLDSAIIANKVLCHTGKMVDIGSGAGFPGIILKILKPGIFLTSVDSSEKKIFFQKNVVRKLNLENVNFVSTRVEDSSFIKEYKNYFDCAMARAVKSLEEVLTLAYPIVKKEGHVFVFKGKNYKYELEAMENSELNKRFSLKTIEPYELPFLKMKHYILIYQKK